MLQANPLVPPQAALLYPTNVNVMDCISTKHYLIRCGIRVRGLSSFPTTTGGGGVIPPNALHRRSYPSWRGGGFSLGVDLGSSHTGLALGKGFFPRPLTVLDLRGKKLEMRLLKIAEMEEADEFIIGLPKSHDGKETPQSNKVRSIAGRIAVQAAERGWRVYLQDEYGTTLDALDYMIERFNAQLSFKSFVKRRLKRSARQERIDAYSALMLLERYFSTSGTEAELVLPKQLHLQEKLKRDSNCEIGPHKDPTYLRHPQA
ncbi:uncharacterized protein LOC110027912 isoform X2 [Phalaenopsis equestris]|uniref:uncharacterized protein LOC110027912 isoform X2 n=1 Tax=Phalaenopsis equestris TaxID=78828 RepID=UPI0009E24D3F|nr:uncharacterized protein LOC110027912 isoform X2 [Phalaenopsis equestris]